MAQWAPVNRPEWFDVVAPAGTTQAAPLEVATTFAPGVVVRVELDVPDGHSGFTGIYLAAAHGRAIPITFGSWIVANDAELGWDLVEQLDSGAWSAFVYNTDIYDHTFYVRFFVLDVHLAQSFQPAPPTLTPVLV